MTVSTEKNKEAFAIYSGAAAYNWTGFVINADADVEVYAVFPSDAGDAAATAGEGSRLQLTLTTDFTVASNTPSNGGAVTINSTGNTAIIGHASWVSNATTRIAIYRSVDAITQLNEYNNQGAFLSNTIEASFDGIYFILQQHEERLGRTIQLDPWDTVLDGFTEANQRAAVRLNDLSTGLDGVVVWDGTTFNISTSVSSADLATVAGISTAVSTVAGISANVTTVAGIAANVTTVAGIAANVTTVAGVSADVTTVAADISGADTIGSAAVLVDAGNPGIPFIASAGSASLVTFGTGLALDGAGELTIDAELTDISGLTPTNGLFIVGDGADFVGESGDTALTSLGGTGIGISAFKATDGTAGQYLKTDGAGAASFATPAGAGDVLAAANETITGDWTFSGALVYADDARSTASYTTLKALGAGVYSSITVEDASRGGLFVWTAGDQSTNVTNDPGEGVYVPPSSDATGASGAWKRSALRFITPNFCGADGTAANDRQALLDAVTAVKNNAGTYLYIDDVVLIGAATVLDLENVHTVFGPEGVIHYTATLVTALTIGANDGLCVIDNMRIDGQSNDIDGTLSGDGGVLTFQDIGRLQMTSFEIRNIDAASHRPFLLETSVAEWSITNFLAADCDVNNSLSIKASNGVMVNPAQKNLVQHGIRIGLFDADFSDGGGGSLVYTPVSNIQIIGGYHTDVGYIGTGAGACLLVEQGSERVTIYGGHYRRCRRAAKFENATDCAILNPMIEDLRTTTGGAAVRVSEATIIAVNSIPHNNFRLIGGNISSYEEALSIDAINSIVSDVIMNSTNAAAIVCGTNSSEGITFQNIKMTGAAGIDIRGNNHLILNCDISTTGRAFNAETAVGGIVRGGSMVATAAATETIRITATGTGYLFEGVDLSATSSTPNIVADSGANTFRRMDGYDAGQEYYATAGGYNVTVDQTYTGTVTFSEQSAPFEFRRTGVNDYDMYMTTAGADGWAIYDATASKYRLFVSDNGNVGIGNITSPGDPLTVLGSITARETDDGGDAVRLLAGATSGAIQVYSGGVQKISLVGNGNDSFIDNSQVAFGKQTASYQIDSAGDINVDTGQVYRVNSVAVVGAQGAAIADATDAATAISQLNLLLARARAHGLIAT